MSNLQGVDVHNEIVHPYSFNVVDSHYFDEPVKCEKGFSFAIPKDKQIMLKLQFLRFSLEHETDPEEIKYLERRIQQVQEENQNGLSRVLKRVFKRNKDISQ